MHWKHAWTTRRSRRIHDTERMKRISPPRQSDSPLPAIEEQGVFYAQRKPQILLEGYLKKRGHWNPSWKTRYFVFDDMGRLFYFKTKEDSMNLDSSCGRVPINRFVSFSQPSSIDGQAVFQFTIPPNDCHNGRTFTLAATNIEEAQKWVHALQDIGQHVFYICFPMHIRHW
mmetsp:Transcript_40924/g.109475  ORF Transcript_40924/g.109475 Transcript_40924/m.109475 type:complete len:171 (+) Transcript_40924:145-657(+)